MDQTEAATQLPECCGTGCVVCVLDYPELYLKQDHSSTCEDEVKLLEAIEEAERIARQIVSEYDDV